MGVALGSLVQQQGGFVAWLAIATVALRSAIVPNRDDEASADLITAEAATIVSCRCIAGRSCPRERLPV